MLRTRTATGAEDGYVMRFYQLLVHEGKRIGLLRFKRFERIQLLGIQVGSVTAETQDSSLGLGILIQGEM